MDEKIPEGLDDLLNDLMNESKDDSSPEGLDDLLKSIRDEVKDDAEVEADKSSGAIIVIPKRKEEQDIPEGLDDLLKNIRDEDLVEEEIDSRILEVLGLTDAFDLTYGEYKTLLRERAAAGRMGDSTMSTELTELITNEFKRVRGKEGKFKIRKKKVDVDSVFNRKTPSPERQQLDPTKLLPPDETTPGSNLLEGVVEQNEEIISGLSLFSETLEGIKSLLSKQLQRDKKEEQNLRKETQKDKKKEKESKLESKKKKDSKLDTKTLTSPVSGFFDSIKKYFGNILAGSVVVGLLKWLKDPRNERSVNNFKEFFIKQGPLILGGILALALLPVASTLLNLSIAVVSATTALIGSFGKIFAFLTSPIGLGLLGGVGLYALARAYRNKRDADVEQKFKDAERGAELIEQGGKSIMANTPSGVATIKQGNIPWWNLGAQFENIKNKLFGGKDITKSEDLDELTREYNKVNNELYNKLQAYKSGDIRFNKDIENLSIKKQALSERIKQIKQFVPGSTESEEDLSADGLQKHLDSLAKPKTSLVPDSPNIRSGPNPNSTFNKPNKSKFSSFFGSKESFRKKAHEGIDDPIPSGTELSFNQSGKILDVYRTSSTSRDAGGGYGQFVKVQLDDGKVLLMAHLSEISSWVKNGVKFNANDLIAKSGGAVGAPGSGRSGGPHLHFEQHNTPGLGLEETLRGKVDPIKGGGIAALQYGGINKKGKVEMASPQSGANTPQIRRPAAIPSSISPLSPRPSLTPLPIPIPSPSNTTTSSSSPSQTPVPVFSSEDPNNVTMMVVKGIYNIVG